MSIINEQFVMTNVTSEQYKSYFYEPPPALSNVNVGVSGSSSSSSSSSQHSTNFQSSSSMSSNPPTQNSSIEQHELMIREFSAKSNLNIEWSKQYIYYLYNLILRIRIKCLI
jgi:hypothetical protein